MEDSKREQDLKIVECETLRHDLKSAIQRLDASREIQAKLEMETHQQADELDIAKDKVAKLTSVEQVKETKQGLVWEDGQLLGSDSQLRVL